MSFYSEMADTALELIDEFGQHVFIIRTGDITHPVTGITTTGNGAPIRIKVIIRTYPDKLIDGTRIKKGDREIILAGSVEPLITDQIRLSGQDWQVESIKTSSPGGVPIVFFIQVRK